MALACELYSPEPVRVTPGTNHDLVVLSLRHLDLHELMCQQIRFVEQLGAADYFGVTTVLAYVPRTMRASIERGECANILPVIATVPRTRD